MFKSKSLIIRIFSLWKYINKARKKEAIIILFLMVAASLSEIISISSVYPFIMALSNPEKLFQIQF